MSNILDAEYLFEKESRKDQFSAWANQTAKVLLEQNGFIDRHRKRRERIERMGDKRRAFFKLARGRKFQMPFVDLTEAETKAYYAAMPRWKRIFNHLLAAGVGMAQTMIAPFPR